MTGPDGCAPNRPRYSGSALVVAMAAPVVAGTIFAAAARPPEFARGDIDDRLAGGIGVNRRHRRLLDADASLEISMTGVMQLVVQLAHEMMAVVRPDVFTPWTIVSTSSCSTAPTG